MGQHGRQVSFLTCGSAGKPSRRRQAHLCGTGYSPDGAPGYVRGMPWRPQHIGHCIRAAAAFAGMGFQCARARLHRMSVRPAHAPRSHAPCSATPRLWVLSRAGGTECAYRGGRAAAAPSSGGAQEWAVLADFCRESMRLPAHCRPQRQRPPEYWNLVKCVIAQFLRNSCMLDSVN